MKKMWAFVVVMVCTTLVVAQQKPAESAKAPEPQIKMSVVQASPEWEKIKSLAGDWEHAGGQMKGSTTYKVTGAGSAVMMMLPGEKPGEEMVTMFHPDGKSILVTHYCSAKNQPRMKMVPSTNPNEIRFKFMDITNLTTADTGHMQELALIFEGPDRHVQEWTFLADGKTMVEKFEMTRVKK